MRNPPCPKCKGTSRAIGCAWGPNATPIYPHFCLHCGTTLTTRATKREADAYAYAKTHGTLVRVRPTTSGGPR